MRWFHTAGIACLGVTVLSGFALLYWRHVLLLVPFVVSGYLGVQFLLFGSLASTLVRLSEETVRRL